MGICFVGGKTERQRGEQDRGCYFSSARNRIREEERYTRGQERQKKAMTHYQNALKKYERRPSKNQNREYNMLSQTEET